MANEEEPPRDARALVLPAGSSLDLDQLREVASVSNRAHRALGTRLLGLEPNAVLLGIDRPPPEATGGPRPTWPNGVVTCLLDHACAMAALIALDAAERFGGTLGLHVDYLRPSDGAAPLHARAECTHHDGALARVEAAAFHPDDPERAVASARASVGVVAP